MASDVSATPMLANGTAGSLSAEDDEQVFLELSRLRDAVLAGTHPLFTLPPAVVAQLQVALAASNDESRALTANGPVVNGLGKNVISVATNHVPAGKQVTSDQAPIFDQSSLPSSATQGLPGLVSPSSWQPEPTKQPVAAAAAAAATFASDRLPASSLNPIFLEKSSELIRAENRLKRQRLERGLQAQQDGRKPTARDRDPAVEGASTVDITAVLAKAHEREDHVSGLQPPSAMSRAASPQSSFDENEYYSSQVESEWSSPASANRGSDRIPATAFSQPASSLPGTQPVQPYAAGPAQSKLVEVIDLDNEDDEYTPPDADAFDAAYEPHGDADMADDESEYEPGEIQEGLNDSSFVSAQTSSLQIPVIRNHLTHIAAPQPNRVSPLAVAKMPSMGQLKLVNGRPEFVQEPTSQRPLVQYDGSADESPGANALGGLANLSKKAKRKREIEERLAEQHSKASKKRSRMLQRSEQKKEKKLERRRQRENDALRSSVVPEQQQPYIKEEPVSSPPPQAKAPVAHAYPQTPQFVDLGPLRRAASPAIFSQGSTPVHRPMQRDTQDLRRVASMQYTQRLRSPPQQTYSPAPGTQYRTVSMPYSDDRRTQRPRDEIEFAHPQEPFVRDARSRSPPRESGLHNSHQQRLQEPALMPPPAAPPRQIFVDQYGNHYYAEPAPSAPIRASLAPIDHYAAPEPGHVRAPSRMAVGYSQAPQSRHETAYASMPPPPPPLPTRTPTSHGMWGEQGGRFIPEYGARPAEREVRYVQQTTSPVYQYAAPNDDLYNGPVVRVATSPVYAAPHPPTRTYSVRPEGPRAPRSGDIAPVQQVEMPRASVGPVAARATSVAPGYEMPQTTHPSRSNAYYPTREDTQRAAHPPPYPLPARAASVMPTYSLAAWPYATSGLPTRHDMPFPNPPLPPVVVPPPHWRATSVVGERDGHLPSLESKHGNQVARPIDANKLSEADVLAGWSFNRRGQLLDPKGVVVG